MIFGKNVLDIIILSILFFCTIRSFFKGIIRETFSLLALVLGIILARQFYYQTAQSWGRWISPKAGNIIAFILLFLVAYLVVLIIGKLFRKIIKTIELNWLDHVGGALLGFLKGLLLVCLLVTVLIMVLSPHEEVLRTSKFIPHVVYIISLSDGLLKAIPPEIRRGFQEKVEELKGFWKKYKHHPQAISQKKGLHIFHGHQLLEKTKKNYFMKLIIRKPVRIIQNES